jgi:crotonobetainyl-CoA:carnitine CoA-transferase CaiB-like acyl-CoA transferase
MDLTRLLPGPFATLILADLGAEVVRVEAPDYQDQLQAIPPTDVEVSAADRQINRNKKSILVNLKNPKGPELIKRLVKDYDVVVEPFRPGVMDRLGVGYEDLKAVKPDLIYCSITGYGQNGPYRLRAGHDANYLALSSVMSYTGSKDGGPLPLGFLVADQCAGGLNATIAILAALCHKERSGRGQYIDLSMTDGCIQLGGLAAVTYLASGEIPSREGDLLNGGNYYKFYETKDGEYLSIGGLEPQFYKAMCEALGREDLLPMHFAKGDDADKLKAELAGEFKKKTRAEWEQVFAQVDACVEPVLSVAEMVEHPVTLAREMVVEVPTREGNKHKQIGSPYKMSETPVEYNFAGVAPGTDTDEVLADAGYSEAEIKELRSKGAVR